jgi:hypothetical protein
MWLSCGIFIYETAVGPQTHRESTHQAPDSSENLLRDTTWSSFEAQELDNIADVCLALKPREAGPCWLGKAGW